MQIFEKTANKSRGFAGKEFQNIHSQRRCAKPLYPSDQASVHTSLACLLLCIRIARRSLEYGMPRNCGIHRSGQQGAQSKEDLSFQQSMRRIGGKKANKKRHKRDQNFP